jgi:hypothetical protein
MESNKLENSESVQRGTGTRVELQGGGVCEARQLSEGALCPPQVRLYSIGIKVTIRFSSKAITSVEKAQTCSNIRSPFPTAAGLGLTPSGAQHSVAQLHPPPLSLQLVGYLYGGWCRVDGLCLSQREEQGKDGFAQN